MFKFRTMWRTMKMLRNRHTTGRKIAVGGVAAATALGLTLLTTSPGSAEEINPNEDAEAFGQLIDADLLDAQAIEALSAYSSSPSNEEAATTPLNLEVLQSLGLELPGIGIPLISEEGGDGLLDLGNAGALNSYGHAPAYNEAKASAGAVGTDGALNLDDINNGEFGNANVDLTSVLGQLGLDGITDQVVDELSLELGAIASTADSNGEADNSEYVVADGILTVSSPAVGDISGALDTLVDGTGETLDEVIGTEGLVNDLAGLGVDVNIPGIANVSVGGEDTTVSVDVRDALNSIVENIVNEKLEDESGIVSIDLANGDIKIDLAKVVEGGNGEDLNGLDPNTQVLTSDTISKITTAVADALGALTGKVTETLTDALNDVHLVIDLPAEATLGPVTLATGSVTVDATLGQLAGSGEGEPEISSDLSVAGLPIGELLTELTEPLLNQLLAITEPLIGGILTATVEELSAGVTDIVDPILTGLDPVFEALNQVVDLTINEQPTLKDEESQVKGNNGPGFTVSAVSLELLPASEAVDINLASSSVRATAEAPEEPGDDDVNTNAAASAAASADADDDSNASAEVAAQAAAQADATTDETAAADSSAEAAAEAAATEDASSETSADATTETNASATVAAEAASNADNTDAANADTTAAADADPAAAASVASNADSSSEASAAAAADADDSAVADASNESDVNANASASAAASADADNNDNAIAEAAAQAAATADADTTASAAADIDASAAAESAATEDSSSEASADATSDPNASAQAAATAAANADDTETANADTTAAADADPAAAAAVASNATSSDDASVEAAANADGTEADAAAEADDSNVDTTAAADADGAEADADADPEGAATAAADGAEAEATASADADGAEASAASDDDADQASASADSDQAASASSSSQSNASASSAGASTNASGSSDGGDLPRTGADGVLTMAGIAALLIAGGAAAIYGTRRYRASAGQH
ncbi:choice-of-anchor G family protein [Brevibacterium aurantiacum]|uniref:Choice-of-anchor G family protein n=2 Tax=Brevibacterium aurantiacum TaxID=273384 RepID=A0A556C3N3_BREAU|nr:choice-of-anchor G family protein [Brevibacterium aurantiacum]